MNILSYLRLRTKLILLMGLSALALLAVIAIAASLVRQRMIEERIDKDRAVVQATLGIAQSLENRVTAQKLSREQALGMLRDDIHAMRFDGGVGYVYAQTLENIIVMHGSNAALEGKPSPATDADGRLLTDMIRDALRSADDGVLAYTFPKPGQTERISKISYAARFAPWNLVFVSGSYFDDLDATFRAVMVKLAAVGGAISVVMLATAWLINRDITGSLGGLKAAMEHLARGNLSTEIPGTGRRDEVGGMASAVLVFKDQMATAARLTAEQDEQRRRAEANKHAALIGMAEKIEIEAKNAMTGVAHQSAAMADTARGMSTSAARTDTAAQSAATAAAQALANVQTVASAAEQLAASIREIGGQVSQSSAVVTRAVEAGRATRERIEALNEQVARIGNVADMISEIAARTNLLALNATIEAARAGDAGKGFAVVAGEVKQLANQTARSTEEITRHIGEVRTATAASVTAVGQIEQTIGEVSTIAGSIAAAVEEQDAATAEIARNVTETAAAANEMTARTNEVSAQAVTTGQQAAEVLENTTGLDAAMRELQSTLIHIVRASTAEADNVQTAVGGETAAAA
jgi:methyl-accepting chemotaxis protein